MKKITAILLLVSFIFSSIHGVVLAQIDNDTCTISQHIQEMQNPAQHGDSCDMHFAFHFSFTLVNNSITSNILSLVNRYTFISHKYQNPLILGSIKPPAQS